MVDEVGRRRHPARVPRPQSLLTLYGVESESATVGVGGGWWTVSSSVVSCPVALGTCRPYFLIFIWIFYLIYNTLNIELFHQWFFQLDTHIIMLIILLLLLLLAIVSNLQHTTFGIIIGCTGRLEGWLIRIRD